MSLRLPEISRRDEHAGLKGIEPERCHSERENGLRRRVSTPAKVPAAAGDRAKRAVAVEGLEDDARVVGEAAHDRRVDREVVRAAVRGREVGDGAELGDGGRLGAERVLQRVERRPLAQGRHEGVDRGDVDAERPEVVVERVRRDLVELVDEDLCPRNPFNFAST